MLLKLTEGSCFGTIEELKGREITTRMLRVLTCEDNCEFLKISIESYDRVTKVIHFYLLQKFWSIYIVKIVENPRRREDKQAKCYQIMC